MDLPETYSILNITLGSFNKPNAFNSSSVEDRAALNISNTLPPAVIIPCPGPNLSSKSALVTPRKSSAFFEPRSMANSRLPALFSSLIDAFTPSILTAPGSFLRLSAACSNDEIKSLPVFTLGRSNGWAMCPAAPPSSNISSVIISDHHSFENNFDSFISFLYSTTLANFEGKNPAYFPLDNFLIAAPINAWPVSPNIGQVAPITVLFNISLDMVSSLDFSSGVILLSANFLNRGTKDFKSLACSIAAVFSLDVRSPIDPSSNCAAGRFSLAQLTQICLTLEDSSGVNSSILSAKNSSIAWVKVIFLVLAVLYKPCTNAGIS